jgi:hypothetical protein
MSRLYGAALAMSLVFSASVALADDGNPASSLNQNSYTVMRVLTTDPRIG